MRQTINRRDSEAQARGGLSFVLPSCLRAFVVSLSLLGAAVVPALASNCIPSASGRVVIECAPQAVTPLNTGANPDTVLTIQANGTSNPQLRQASPQAVVNAATMAGDVVGSPGANTLASSVTAGTYTCPSITVTASGRTTAISSQTCLAAVAGTAPITASTVGGTATIGINAMTATTAGIPPTPPNSTLQYLRGDATFANPYGGAGASVVGAAGKTLTFGGSLTFTGTDGTSFAFPGSSDTIAGLGQTQTFTGTLTFNQPWVSGVTTGNPPFIVNSSTPVAGLNVLAVNIAGTLSSGQLPAATVYTGANQEMTGSLAGGAQTSFTISSSTFTPNLDVHHWLVALIHASCPCTLANPSNISSQIGQSGTLEVDQSSSGSDTIGTWGSEYEFAAGAAPTLSAGANAKDLLWYWVKDATHVVVGVGALAFAP